MRSGRVAPRRAAVLIGLAVSIGVVLGGCSDSSSPDGGDPSTSPITSPDRSPITSAPTKPGSTAKGTAGAPMSPASPPTSEPETSTAGVEGAPMSATLPVGALDVRIVGYRESGYRGAAQGTRVDILTVQECAVRGSARVRHTAWALLGADGARLGSAGGKMVNGAPTEDLPRLVPAGQCVTTPLAVGVPADADVVAARYGPDAVWILSPR